MVYQKKHMQTADTFPNELLVEGVFIASQKEHRQWVKDGVTKEMDVLCIFIQRADGAVFVCRAFNPPYDFADFKQGDKIVLPINEYKIENGVKSVAFRLS